jgi:hypothetical protein
MVPARRDFALVRNEDNARAGVSRRDIDAGGQAKMRADPFEPNDGSQRLLPVLATGPTNDAPLPAIPNL